MRMLTTLFFCVLTSAMMLVHTKTALEALASLQETPYGFCLFDVGITEEDLAICKQLVIQGTYEYNQFGDLSSIVSAAEYFLRNIGNNDEMIVSRVAACIAQITNHIMQVSGQETAWFSLRSFMPTNVYDISRWHVDGDYFKPARATDVPYKFAIALVGDSTMFYKITHEELKKVLRMTDRKYMHSFCTKDRIISPQTGEGVFFMGGGIDQGALHSEPGIHRPRLFFSLVPCNEQQLVETERIVRSLAEIRTKVGAMAKPLP